MVIDASVLAKVFVAEELSAEAHGVLAEAGELWAPGHALAELGETLQRKVALGQMSREQRSFALAASIRWIRIAPLDELLFAAADIADELSLSIYDSLYLALAQARDEELVTWDLRLLRRVRGGRFAARVRPLSGVWPA